MPSTFSVREIAAAPDRPIAEVHGDCERLIEMLRVLRREAVAASPGVTR